MGSMELLLEKEDVWVASLDDNPGALGAMLGLLADAGANLDFMIARRAPEEPGSAVVFVTPLRTDPEIQAGDEAGFSVTRKTHSVRVQGRDEPGVAARIAKAIGEAGFNMAGFSCAKRGAAFVAHIRLDTMEDRDAVMTLLSAL